MSSDAQMAYAVGREYAPAGRSVADCPYNANGEPEERVLAARFVQGYLDEAPAEVDYTDDDAES